MVMGPDPFVLAGEERARESGAATFPVDPHAIARDCDIDVVEKETKGGASGMLLRHGEQFTIAYATHIPVEGFQRFSIAHELGHYFLPGHVDQVFRDGGVHQSRAGFLSRDHYEVEADRFAVGLLMPRKLFRPALQRCPDGLGGIEAMAKICRTSLTSTAIRVADLSSEAMGIVVAEGTKLIFAVGSKAFRDRGFFLPANTTLLPRKTVTERFWMDPARVRDAERDSGEVDSVLWCSDARECRFYEEVLGLGRYERTLTVLTLPDDDDPEEADDDEALVKSWTPTLQRSRRR